MAEINLKKTTKELEPYKYVTYFLKQMQLNEALKDIESNYNNGSCTVTIVLEDSGEYLIDNVHTLKCSLFIMSSPYLTGNAEIVFPRSLFLDEDDSRHGERHFLRFEKDSDYPDVPQRLRIESVSFKPQVYGVGPSNPGGQRPNIAAFKLLSLSEIHINNVIFDLQNETTTNFHFENCRNVTIENCVLSNDNSGWNNPEAHILDFEGSSNDIIVRHNSFEKIAKGSAIRFHSENTDNEFRNISVVGNHINYDRQSNTSSRGSICECLSNSSIDGKSSRCSNIVFSMNDVSVSSSVGNVFSLGFTGVTALDMTGIVFSGNKVVHQPYAGSQNVSDVTEFYISVAKTKSDALPVIDVRKNEIIVSGPIIDNSEYTLATIGGVIVNMTENRLKTIGQTVEKHDVIILCRTNNLKSGLTARRNRVEDMKFILQNVASASTYSFDLILEQNHFEGSTNCSIASPITLNMKYRNNYFQSDSDVFFANYAKTMKFGLWMSDNIFDSRGSGKSNRLFRYNNEYGNADFSEVLDKNIKNNIFVNSGKMLLSVPGLIIPNLSGTNTIIENKAPDEPLQGSSVS